MWLSDTERMGGKGFRTVHIIFLFLQGWLNLRAPHGSIAGGSKKSYPRPGSQREGSGMITKELMKKRIIILALLRREIERLSIWRNPKNMPELRVAGEDIVQGWASQVPMTDKSWKECIRTTWNVCPHVAIHVALRLVDLYWTQIYHYSIKTND